METIFRDSWDRKLWLDVCSTHQDAYKWDWDELASVTDWCLFTQERNFREVSKEGLLSVAKHGLTVLGCNQTEIAVSFMMDEERYRTSISSTKLEFLEEHLCNIPYWIVFGQGYLREMDPGDVDDSSFVGTSFDHAVPLDWEVDLGLDTGGNASKLALAQPDARNLWPEPVFATPPIWIRLGLVEYLHHLSRILVKLTEEQRWQNHNESEQRRRTIIGKNLSMIRDLVPALMDTKPSQTTVILETCEFLHDLVEGNTKLEQNLGPELAGPGPGKTSGK
ncbi:hypothetical protein EJ05DRAFT_501780 [Pseudovirgaria hyperparasitica]|uniref:BHLH domain-containing protein n=1 Tax=Pseudovirgaria hyperparasitica TaxID=470096 RepID=A0A6A6W324_9PEZI|nr:uncharacterized protein EJ05DRAFT_501780 [Pseudovirgaria hyperparasitica]KAF2757252.1 hypothetical protein EJ05DRAFT_501780 [Pseudovirgaria hyperparasitica]